MARAKSNVSETLLLRWSQHVPASDVQDPLGLALRGSSRLASRLLYCITSITPRARYFSFIPWCVYDWTRREKGKPVALGLRQAIILRERALVLGCIAHHDGQACDGGALVGSSSVAKWFGRNDALADLRRIPFAKYPALDAYINSLVNLGFFLETPEVEDSDVGEGEQNAEQTFDDLKLSPLGQELAEAYEAGIAELRAPKELVGTHQVSVKALKKWGESGGLCELADGGANDRPLLRDVFLAKDTSVANSHTVRRESLLLMLELCRQASAHDLEVGEREFGTAVYFDELITDTGRTELVRWPTELADVAARWRMFQHHQYMSIALEGGFSWVVSEASRFGVAGVSFEELVENLESSSVRKFAADLCGTSASGPFGALTPAQSFAKVCGARHHLDAETSRLIDVNVRAANTCSEDSLETLLRSPSGGPSSDFASALLLLGLTLARYARWDDSRYGNWLAQAASDPFVDLVPPVLLRGLGRRFGQWWNAPWSDIARFVLSRYVVQQHQSMAFEKTSAGDRCLLEVDGSMVVAHGAYDRIGIRNQRLPSALQILKDLDLLRDDEDGVTLLTAEGKQTLRDGLRAVAAQ